MGRPEDDIWALHTIKPTPPNKKWKCKHCTKEFAGSATRVREHLFVEDAKNISRCSVFNPSSDSGEKGLKGKGQKKDAKRSSNKRRRNSREGSVSDQAGNIPTTHTNKQQSTDDLLVKFFMSSNIPLDRMKDPNFMSFLTRVAEEGVPSCLNRNDKVVIEKSVFNWECEVKEYMVWVKESWTTTGCTLIHYNFNLDNDNLIYGFYSPKGFIFVQGPRSDSDYHIRDALKNNVLNLSFDDVTGGIYHEEGHTCECVGSDWMPVPSSSVECVASEIQRVWDVICEESKWVEKVVQASEKVYKHLSHPNVSIPRVREVLIEEHGERMAMSSFARLKSIMHLKDHKILLAGDADSSKGIWHAVERIIDDKDFWEDGKQLIKALNPVFQIVNLVDTLCPVSPYIQLAKDSASCTIKSCFDRDPVKFYHIRNWFKFHFFALDDLEAGLFSPIYNIGVDNRNRVIRSISKRNPELEEELHRYNSHNPFQKVDHSLLLDHHPVKLWEKYGSEFPMLKVHAMKVLSEPGSCMCNQIKKKLEQIQGCDNILMRLNYMMMEEFNKLGDSIYKPPPDFVVEKRAIQLREENNNIGSGEEKNNIGSGESSPSDIVETITNPECELRNGLQPEMANPCGLISSTETAVQALPPYLTSFTPAQDNNWPMITDVSEYMTDQSDTIWHLNTHISEHMTNQAGCGEDNWSLDIPPFMREHVSDPVNVKADGNCGFRAIAHSLGLEEDSWVDIRNQLWSELISNRHLFEPAIPIKKVDLVLAALDWQGKESAPLNKWFDSTDMGALVATTFTTIFVVLKKDGGVMYPPLYLPPDYDVSNLRPTIVLVWHENNSHYTALRLRDDSPLPELDPMWEHHHQYSIKEIPLHLSERCKRWPKLDKTHTSLATFIDD